MNKYNMDSRMKKYLQDLMDRKTGDESEFEAGYFFLAKFILKEFTDDG